MYREGRPQVLCFQAFFKESVHESTVESERVHKCDIFYYTEDDSIEITERFHTTSWLSLFLVGSTASATLTVRLRLGLSCFATSPMVRSFVLT